MICHLIKTKTSFTMKKSYSRFHSGTTVVSSLHASEVDTLEHSSTLKTLAKRLVLANANSTENDSSANKKIKIAFAIAGGGSRAISSLASTPGASSILHSGNVLYDRTSFAQYVSQYLPSESTNVYISNIKTSCQNRDGRFGFASSGAAVLLSQAALNQAYQTTKSLQGMEDIIGVGCTSTLVSHGREHRKSRVHIAISKGNIARTALYNIILGNSEFIEREAQDQLDSTISKRRDRNEEEELVAKLILNSILQGIKKEGPLNEDMLRLDVGDSIEIVEIGSAQDQSSVANLVGRIIDQNEKSVDAAILTQSSVDKKMKPISQMRITPDYLIFPGSFNPPHIGHVSLAQAAVKVMTDKRRLEIDEYFNTTQNEGSDNVVESLWKTIAYEDLKLVDHIGNPPFTVLFEMSLTNADKPAMEVSEAIRRIELFEELQYNTNDTSQTLSNDWGVLLTSAPLFIDKVKCLKKYLCQGAKNNDHIRKMTFVIGTDTMVRLINPKYYNNDYEMMLLSLKKMQNEGVHFVVGGRVSQNNVAADAGDVVFVTGEEELESLPKDAQEMFTLMPEFRVDISSTELRKQKSK
jgi:nicotinic acid mononucleotide adenylyltransferase